MDSIVFWWLYEGYSFATFQSTDAPTYTGTLFQMFGIINYLGPIQSKQGKAELANLWGEFSWQ